MTNWNRIKEIERLNTRELELNISDSASWHTRYKNSAYIFVGNLHYDLTEGDLITVFSQFGEIVDCNLIRDKETGDSKGFAFIAFENQKSTNIAIDNMNGSLLLKRTLNVDHVLRYRKPKHYKDREKKLQNNEYGDIDEDDETYEQRRKKIWDYEKYLNINIDKYKSKTTVSDNGNNIKINYNQVNKVNKKYLKEKQQTEMEFTMEKNELNKQIEIRKLKRKLLRMKKNENNYKNFDERGKDKKMDKRKDNEWIDYGNELRDSSGRLIDVEKELKKRKNIEEIAKREQYEKEIEEIKLQKKKKRLEQKSKSEILNAKLKKLSKKLKKKKHKKFKGVSGDLPFKKRKFNS